MRWKQFRYRLEWLGVKALAVIIPRLPRRACAILSNFAGAAVFLLDGRGRAVTLANIEAAFGDRYTPPERLRIARASYQNFARTMLDLFWAPRLPTPSGAKYVELDGAEILQQHAGKPRVVMCAHYAGFEWASLGCGLQGFRGYTLTQAFKNPLLDSLFTALRTSTGQSIITQDISMLRMLRQVMKGNLVGMLIDLNLSPSQSATVIDTFGMKMCVTYLHAILAQRAGASLIPMTSEPLPDGRCKVRIHPPIEFPENASIQQIVQIAWNFFEGQIRSKPELWMWAYKHWRFRPAGDTHPYPFYAQSSAKFEKLAQSIAKAG